MSPLSRIPALRGISASMHVIVEPLDFNAHLGLAETVGRLSQPGFTEMWLRDSDHQPEIGRTCEGQ